MDLSIFLARAWGLYSILVALALLINRKWFLRIIDKVKADDIGVLLAGTIALAIGVAQVIGYEVWDFNYMGLITLFGWIALIKGAAILFFPGYMEKFSNSLVKRNGYVVIVGLFLILGLYLLYSGFAR